MTNADGEPSAPKPFQWDWPETITEPDTVPDEPVARSTTGPYTAAGRYVLRNGSKFERHLTAAEASARAEALNT